MDWTILKQWNGVDTTRAVEVHDNLLFVDEFGQDKKPGKKALGMLFLPKPAMNEVIDFVGDLIQELHGDRSLRVSVKGVDWPDEFACRFADMVRAHRWIVGMPSRDSRDPGWANPDARFADLTAAMEENAELLHIEPSEVERFREFLRAHWVYFDQFYDIVKLSVNELADHGILLRRLDVVADEKIGKEFHFWMEWFIYVAMTGRYPHLEPYFYRRQGPKLISFDSDCDENNEGLILADAIAFWHGINILPADVLANLPFPAERYKYYLRRMNTGWQPETNLTGATPNFG